MVRLVSGGVNSHGRRGAQGPAPNASAWPASTPLFSRPSCRSIYPLGSLARYHALEWVNFVATELHKSFSPLFRPNTPDDYKPVVKELIAGKFALVERRLTDLPYLTGQQYSIADIYCFVMLTWARAMQINLSDRPQLQAYSARLAERPAVRDALAAEKLG